MHTFETRDGTLFHHNSDLSGKVTISELLPDGSRREVSVLGLTILNFIAHHVRAKRIGEIERMSVDRLLRINRSDP